MRKSFSWQKTLLKMVKFLICVLLPWLVDYFVVTYPEWGQITIATILYGLVNVLKNRFGVKLP